MPSSVLIIGAGISGLSTAWNLRQRAPELEITVLEAAGRPGGTAWTEKKDGFLLELGPNGFLDNRPSTLDLCKSLELSDLHTTDLRGADRYLFFGDRLRRLPSSPGEFLLSDILSWKGQLRAIAERFIPRKRSHDDESIAAFGRRRVGAEATEKILDAVVTGILAGDSELLSLPACFPRLAALEEEFGSLIRAQGALAKRRKKAGEPRPGSSMIAPTGGMRSLIETLVTRLSPAVHFHKSVTRIERAGPNTWQIHTLSETWDANAVVLACPAPAQAEILRPLDPGLAQDLSGILYVPAVVAAVAYRKRDLPTEPKGFGYLAPQRMRRPVLGVQWSSSVVPGQAPPDQFLFRAILGGWQRGDVIHWDDSAILKVVREDLKATLGITAEPSFHSLFRWERAIPQYHVGHLERLRRISAAAGKHSGLFLTGNAFRGVAINDCTADGERTASEILELMNAQAPANSSQIT